MALTYTTVARGVAGNKKYRIVDFTADGVTTTSYSLATSDLETLAEPGASATSIVSFDSEVFTNSTSNYSLSFNRSTPALFFLANGAAVTSTLSVTVRACLSYAVSNPK